MNGEKVRRAVERPIPDAYNFRYFQAISNESIAQIYTFNGIEELFTTTQGSKENQTPCIKYAVSVLDGKQVTSTQNKFFGDFLKALTIINEKKAQDVGLEGMKMPPMLAELAEIIEMISPQAFRVLKEYIPLPNRRTLHSRRHRANVPKFPVDITERTFELALEHVKKIGFAEGPYIVCVDDTELQPAIRPFYDADQFHEALQNALVEKATKPLCPGASAWEILQGLWGRGIHVVGYSCDGTTIERNVQHKLELTADKTHTYTLYDPRTNDRSIVFKVKFFSGHPLACIQDDLHLLKTLRNNASSGARILVFPNCVVMFSQIREIALQDGPLFKRDVIKLDRQDDNAAQRLFSASTIQWLTCSDRPEIHIGLVVYLFIFGELVDAYQNRRISLLERCRMVLRAYFFLDFWETFLDQAHYPKAKYFLSKEVVDIIRISIRGFFEILFIHRDHLGRQWALFAYLTGTSLCEHVFGMARTFDPDFTLYSWYILKPKLTMMLEQAIQKSWQTPDSKARASGYNHSYLDRHGVDVQTLSLFPTNNQIDDASQMGYDDAFDLFCLLGLSPNELTHERSSTLPSIRMWFTEELTSIPISSSTPGNQNIDADSDSESETESEVDAAESSLLSTLEMVENIEPYAVEEERDLMSQRFAAVALELDKSISLAALSAEAEEADEEATELSSESRSAVADLASSLSNPNHDEPSRRELRPHDHTDLNVLVSIRQEHQSRVASSGVRIQQPFKHDNQDVERATAEKKLKASFQQIVNNEAAKDRGGISGLSRKTHYTKSAKGGTGREAGEMEKGLEETSGNSANAAAVASQTAKSLLTKRTNAYKKFPTLNVRLHNACISNLHKLDVSFEKTTYGFAIVGFNANDSYDSSEIVLCRVLCLYEKSGGKNGKHGLVDSTNNICALSYLPAQTYQKWIAGQFRVSPRSTPWATDLRFTQLTPNNFLTQLQALPNVLPNGSVKGANIWVDCRGSSLDPLEEYESIPVPVPALKVDTPTPPPFNHNALHDIESVWWVLVYTILFNEDPAGPSQKTSARQDLMNTLFDGQMNNNLRLAFLRDPQFDGCLASSFSFIVPALREYAKHLTAAFSAAEKDYPIIQPLAAPQIHGDCIRAFYTKPILGAITKVKMTYVKIRAQDVPGSGQKRTGNHLGEPEGSQKKKSR
ncbi:hypothetical protein DFJ43DRAFT_1167829 [Lentinula guzmanii]|uniref:Fungal-type protein kinase domain-containing protein n=1 Tax=Lentinula guzmanii TaxID=2804957 RepID=A0AA38J5K2_9AGAR|nr:hypothetical protein DFJ43DRAFT_1167829 [Lentinula guzmanii]